MFPTAESALFELETLVSVALAILLGFIIGFERKMRSKEAGIRTHAILCAGAALMMIVSKYGFADTEKFDASRIAAQVVSGIGFLGVGIILFRQQEVRGLTTAAGLWTTAGVGLAAGAGMYVLAAGATLLIVLMQLLFHTKLKPFVAKKMCRLNIVFKLTHGEDSQIKEKFGVQHFYSFRVKADESGLSVCEATIFTNEMYRSEKLIAIREELPCIISIERIDAY